MSSVLTALGMWARTAVPTPSPAGVQAQAGGSLGSAGLALCNLCFCLSLSPAQCQVQWGVPLKRCHLPLAPQLWSLRCCCEEFWGLCHRSVVRNTGFPTGTGWGHPRSDRQAPGRGQSSPRDGQKTGQNIVRRHNHPSQSSRGLTAKKDTQRLGFDLSTKYCVDLCV